VDSKGEQRISWKECRLWCNYWFQQCGRWC
jgi:hypothetical protein